MSLRVKSQYVNLIVVSDSACPDNLVFIISSSTDFFVNQLKFYKIFPTLFYYISYVVCLMRVTGGLVKQDHTYPLCESHRVVINSIYRQILGFGHWPRLFFIALQPSVLWETHLFIRFHCTNCNCKFLIWFSVIAFFLQFLNGLNGLYYNCESGVACFPSVHLHPLVESLGDLV